MREAVRGCVLQHDAWSHGNRPPRVTICTQLVTLYRFDDKLALAYKTGPFIPCERRLANTGILEIQGRVLWAGFLKQGLCQAS